MIFGIGSGLFFSYIPFIKLNGLPASSYRILPGWIFKRVTSRLGIQMHSETFRNPEKAMLRLDETLEKGLPVGLLTSVFYLPYLPKALRFHFNAHNIVIFGKENGNYLVSDPVADTITEISCEDLKRARFAKGTLAPKGKMYYPINVPANVNLEVAIKKGIKKTATDMVNVPVPFFGLKGIKFMAGSLRKWPEKISEKESILRLGQLIRMQEEIGTGGAGFRFIFAAFLQEASAILGKPELREISMEVTETGDKWREFAFEAGRVCKGRAASDISFGYLADILVDCARREEKIFKSLKSLPL
jgi:hypothetical protein